MLISMCSHCKTAIFDYVVISNVISRNLPIGVEESECEEIKITHNCTHIKGTGHDWQSLKYNLPRNDQCRAVNCTNIKDTRPPLK